MKKTTARGFTLVELLVVIAIIAILAAVVVLIINPLELTRRSRDAARLTDLANLQQAINVAVQEASNAGTNLACAGTGATCRRVSGPSTDGAFAGRTTDGNGWVAINLGVQTSVSVPTLPVDPTNNAAYHYTYCGSGDNWQIMTVLESTQQSPKMETDGGDSTAAPASGPDSDGVYEVGSVLNLLGTAGCANY